MLTKNRSHIAREVDGSRWISSHAENGCEEHHDKSWNPAGKGHGGPRIERSRDEQEFTTPSGHRHSPCSRGYFKFFSIDWATCLPRKS